MFPIMFNDAAYAKLGMGPLWAEIMDIILPIVKPDDMNDRASPSNRLAVFSGHDTTILPILGTLGSNVWDGVEWTPYASMLLLEIHELIDMRTDKAIFPSQYGFRLLYNGKVLTDKMDGCQKGHDLCDIQVLLDRIVPIATRDRECAATPQKEVFVALEQSSQIVTSSWGGLMLVLVVILSSAAGGGVGMYYYLTKRMPWREAPIPYDEVGLNDLEFTANYRDDPTTEEHKEVIQVI